MRRILLLLPLLLLFGSAACSSIESDKPGVTVKGVRYSDTQIAEGRIYYEQTCAACHGVNGEGQFPDAPLVPDATGRYGAPPHRENGHTWHHTDELLIRYIIEGGFADLSNFYPMPAWGGLYDRDEAALIIAYIKTMWTEEQRRYQHHMTEEEELLVSQTKR